VQTIWILYLFIIFIYLYILYWLTFVFVSGAEFEHDIQGRSAASRRGRREPPAGVPLLLPLENALQLRQRKHAQGIPFYKEKLVVYLFIFTRAIFK
jgi:hypothetical protein